MEKLGILIISKCLSASAIIDTFLRSEQYKPEFYVVEKQINPFNFDKAKVHHVIPDLNVEQVSRFASRYKDNIAFGLTDAEDFVIDVGRRKMPVPMLCVTDQYAVEKSKAGTRELFGRICPEMNPRFEIFDPKKENEYDAISRLRKLSDELKELVIKPDAPTGGARVGVWGREFSTEDEMFDFFRNVYSGGRVVVEEKIDGEESSLQAFSDGKHLIVAPQVRDYKRSENYDRGRLTGGMGSYRDSEYWLPFLTHSEWEDVLRAEQDAFEKWKGPSWNPGLRGIVLYDALMHTGSGFKILERNSRGGNTELINILTTMKSDFVDVCYKMLDGELKGIQFSNEASVVTCAVPLTYGGYQPDWTGNTAIDLKGAYAVAQMYDDGKLRIFPMDIRRENGKIYFGTSRSVAVVGIGKTIEEAREISWDGTVHIKGELRSRSDIASEENIQLSAEHLKSLRLAYEISKTTA